MCRFASPQSLLWTVRDRLPLSPVLRLDPSTQLLRLAIATHDHVRPNVNPHNDVHLRSHRCTEPYRLVPSRLVLHSSLHHNSHVSLALNDTDRCARAYKCTILGRSSKNDLLNGRGSACEGLSGPAAGDLDPGPCMDFRGKRPEALKRPLQLCCAVSPPHIQETTTWCTKKACSVDWRRLRKLGGQLRGRHHA
ncbi:hypothetical protein BD413DRAFT_281408 [Trametes elegans]|nr:hypothetical protein BD413DRAFT_281408 [Trametes elegans]